MIYSFISLPFCPDPDPDPQIYADPDPGRAKTCGSVRIRIRIRNPGLINEQFLCLPPIDVLFKAHVQHPVCLVQDGHRRA